MVPVRVTNFRETLIIKMADGSRNTPNNTAEDILSQNRDQVRTSTSRTSAVTCMSHVKCKKSHICQDDHVMSHCCAEVINTTVRDNGSSMDSVSSIDSVSSNQVICGGHIPAVSDRGIHKEKFKVENQQSKNTDSLQFKCADLHIAVRVEWGNMVHNCVLCHSIKAKIEKLVCILNNGSLELTNENLETNASYNNTVPGDVSHSTQTVHPVAADQGEVDTLHPRGIDLGEADSGCAFFQDTKADIKTLICSEGIGNMAATGLKEIGNLQLTDTEAVVGICPILNINQEFGGEVCNMESPGDGGDLHAYDKVPLEVPRRVESMGPVTPSPSTSLLSVEPRGQSLEIPSTEKTLTTNKQPSHKARLPGMTLRVILCNRGAQCYHNQPQDYLSKRLKTVKGCDDLRVQEQQHTGVQNNLNVGEISDKEMPNGDNGTLDGGKGRILVPQQSLPIGKLKPHHRRKHRSTHTGEKPSECIFCHKKFFDQSTLKRHQWIHTCEKPFECNVCGKKFPRRDYLLRHQRKHTDEKPFDCVLCHKKFSDQSALKRHCRIHTDEKPHICIACGKQFSRRDYLLTHQRMHIAEKPFECIVCHKKFSHQGTLKIHRRIHPGEKPFECNVCGKKFPRKDYLLKHQRTHTGEKPFKCIVCHRKFSDQSTHKRHQRMHTGEKPQKCPTCGKRFSRRDNLLNHQRMHTA